VIDLDPTANLANGQEITLTGAGWPAGKTLYVSECRLDMGLSGDTCDPNTTQTYTVEPDGTLPTSPASTYIVTRDISTNSGAVLCGAFVNSCGLVAVTWPGEPGIGSPSRLDMPGNNVINFSGAVARVPVFYLSTAPSGPVAADVNGFGWARNALVTIEVDGTARSPDATAYTSPFGSFTTSGSTVVVEVGDVVTVSDGISTKTQVVPPLTVTEVNIGADKVMGTADPDGLEPFVQVEPTPSPLAETAASMTDGDWTANFSPASDDPYDIVGGTWGIAFQYDDDGDATATRWVATDDGDGVDEPPGYDGNGDDIADAQQANVTSLANAVDQQLVTIASPPGTSLTSVAAIDPSTLPAEGRPSLDRLPIGVLSFEVYVEDEGDAADVVLYLPAGVTADAYFKYHDAWSQYPDVTFAGSQVTLHLVDGEAGDGDDAANSVIVDPGAPADVFDFAGFFAPVNNLPVRNSVKAGKAIPVKFSLGGDQGLDIFAAGSPTSRSVDCNSQAPTDEIETTIESPGASRLTYDAESDRYQLVWKTDKAWRGCRLLTLKLRDGTTHRAIFEFK
jgi:hypothetical protein